LSLCITLYITLFSINALKHKAFCVFAKKVDGTDEELLYENTLLGLEIFFKNTAVFLLSRL
jgi:hypothetical protein